MRHAIAWAVGLVFCASAYASLPYLPPGWHSWWVFFPFKGTELIKVTDPNSPGYNILGHVAALAVDFDADVVIKAGADMAEPDPDSLSRTRGEAVKAELVRLGVPAAHIEIRAQGNTRPLVQTPPGVAERQNRNAELTIGNWRRRGTSTPDAAKMPAWYAGNCEPPDPPDSPACETWKPIYGKK